MIKRQMHPTRVLALGFLAIILVGTLLLMLPIAATTGKSVGFVNALFTATSCTCVTGLAVVETGVVYSTFGHVVMLLLIQVGGLGFMTAAALLFMAVGKRIGLKDRMTIAEGLNESGLSGLVRLVKRVCLLTFGAEAVGAVLLCVRFIPLYGVGKGIWFSVFHAVSAFCNAGFDLFGLGTSLESFAHDPYVLLVIAALVIIGGIGFAVITDMWKKRRFSAYALHTKIVLVTTGALLLTGTLLFLLAEYNNPATLGNMPWGEKILNAFFQSMTLRTAGFASIPQSGLTGAGYLLCLAFMFIGASPASTGGGIKTTTFFALILLVLSVVRGKKDLEVFGRKLPEDTGRKVVAIVCIGFAIAFAMALLLCLLEPALGVKEILYESISAFGTVGNSMGITAALSAVSKLVVTVGMFCGRVGPLTIALALSAKGRKESNVRYPEEKIMVG